MKYKVGQLEDGTWAVMTGKKYFPSTVTNDKAVAESSAATKSAIWHLEQAEKAQKLITSAQQLYDVAGWADSIARGNTIDRLEEIGSPVNEYDPYAYLA